MGKTLFEKWNAALRDTETHGWRRIKRKTALIRAPKGHPNPCRRSRRVPFFKQLH